MQGFIAVRKLNNKKNMFIKTQNKYIKMKFKPTPLPIKQFKPCKIEKINISLFFV